MNMRGKKITSHEHPAIYFVVRIDTPECMVTETKPGVVKNKMEFCAPRK